MEDRDSERRGRRKRMGRLLVIAAALAVIALALVAGVLLINPPAVAQAVKAEGLPRISASLGRRVDAGAVRVRLLPRPRAVLENVQVAGAPGDPPMLRARRVSGSLALWPLIKSRGKSIEITSLTLDEPEVVLVREPAGQWSFEGLGGAAQPSRGPARQAAIEEAAVRRGTLRLIDRTAEPPAVVTVTDIDARARDLGSAGSESVELRAALFSDRQNARADAQSRAGQGGAREWSGQISISSASLEAVRQALPNRVPEGIRGGLLDLRATFSASPPAISQAQGQLSARALQIGGRPASARSDFTMSEAPSGALSASLTNLAVSGPGLDLGGRVDFAGSPPSIRFALRGRTLDVEALKAASAAPPGPPSRPSGPSGPSPLVEVRAAGTVHWDEVLAGGLAAQDVNAQVALQSGVLTLSRCRARLYGGEVSADGTRIDLRRPVPAWSLRTRFQGVDLASAQRAASGKAPLEGHVQGELALDGTGLQWKAMAPTLTGQGTVRVADATLTSADLDRQLAGALSGALSAVGVGGSPAGAPLAANRRGTPLRDLNASFRVANGAVQLTRPLRASTDLGDASLGGSVGLDQQLHLSGTVSLSPKAIAGISGGKLGLAQNVTLPVSVGGTLSAPALQLPSPPQIAAALVAQGPVGGAMRQLGQELQRQARQGLQRAVPLP